LVPFHYYGIFDEVDYSQMRFVGGRYNEEDLNEAYIGNQKRNELIYKHYRKYNSRRALGFCCSRLHAEMMAKDFCERGVRAAAVYSDAQGEFTEEREHAIAKLVHGELEVIFSVDMFNEGVDIPSVDMVMFLRPTESPVVFLQQLGRGLRLYKGKSFLTVLDFIGNYVKAEQVPLFLAGERPRTRTGVEQGRELKELTFPDDCIVDFDIPLLDLFSFFAKRTLGIKQQIDQEFYRIKELLGGRVPTRCELFNYMDVKIYALCLKNSKFNIFKNYMSYREEQHLLTRAEQELASGIGREFLHLLETTSMTKVYKMPVLRAFYNYGSVLTEVTKAQLLASWKEFFREAGNWKDLTGVDSFEAYNKITDDEHLKNILRNPVNFLKKSGNGFFVDKEGFALALPEGLKPIISNYAFAKEMADIIAYRTLEYYRSRYERLNANENV
jgi:hypothetical protein